MAIEFKCEDFLKDNQRWYATKAGRKKISIIRIEATNHQSSEVRLDLASSRLTTSGGKEFAPECPAVVVRKLTEFTWEFLFFAITDFHPVFAVIDLTLFLFGPFYNRRLKRQLAMLSDGEMSLSPGETKTALVAFRGVKKALEHLTMASRGNNGDEQQLQYDFTSA